MSPEMLLQQFDVMADAPNGVQKLRELILQLAVRGKLVPQDPSEEPASVLLERIEEEKQRLVKEGMVRKLKESPPIRSGEISFELPQGWEWVRLGKLGDWGSGATPRRGVAKYYGGSIPWLKSGELNDGFVSQSEETITETALAECSLRLNEPGDVLIAMYGATIGKLAILETRATTNQAVCACTCFAGVYNQFLFYLLKTQRLQFVDQGAGGAQPNISKEKIVATVVPLPPTDEQRRIVAKVDQLMALCDELEERQRRRAEKRVRLNRASLHHLTAATDDTELAGNWQRLRENFDLLYDTPETVAELRQAVLQLAVRGKLVPQDTSDEPASVLLEQIEAEKQRLVKEGKIGKPKALPPIEPDEEPFEVPEGWEWVRLGQVFDVRDGTHDTPKYVSAGVPLVTSKNLSSGCLDLTNVKFISQRDHRAISQRSGVTRLDILFAMIGSIGNPVIVDVTDEFSIKNVALFKYYSLSLSNPWFLRYWLLHAANHMRLAAAGGVQSFVSLGYLRKYSFPLPPLPEQRRIVEKVDKLMALCDDLEAKLTRSRNNSEHLASAVVHHLTAARYGHYRSRSGTG